MKKLLLLLILPFLLSCSDDDDDIKPGKHDNINNLIIGHWVQVQTHPSSIISHKIFTEDYKYRTFTLNNRGDTTTYSHRGTDYIVDETGFYMYDNILPTLYFMRIHADTLILGGKKIFLGEYGEINKHYLHKE